MREFAKKPENQSHTLDSNPKASKQAPISEILQSYRDRTFGKPVQRQSADEDELLQAKAAQQDQVNAVSQRYASDDDELIQGKFDTVQHEDIDEEELLQGKFESAPTVGQTPIQREKRPNNTGLPDNLKSGIENLSGYSMDDVKVHYNSDKPVQLNALAYAQGTDIHLAPSQEKHLPHEAWHIVQQKQGRVKPTVQMQGVQVNDDKWLEKEADNMGKSSESWTEKQIISQNSSVGTRSTVAQRRIEFISGSSHYEPKLTFIKTWLLQTGKMLRDIEKRCINLMIQDDIKREYPCTYGQKEFLEDLHIYTMLFKSPFGSQYDQYIDEIPRIEIIPREDENYEQIEVSGGGAHYDPKKGVIYFCEGYFSKRTFLHELGHFKQQKDLNMTGEQFFKFYSENKKLVEYHNIVKHENSFDYEEKYVPKTKGKIYDMDGKRVMYSSGELADVFDIHKEKKPASYWGDKILKGLTKKVSAVTKEEMMGQYPEFKRPQYDLYSETINIIFSYDEKLRYQSLYHFWEETRS